MPTRDQADRVRSLLRSNKRHTVCEDTARPNLPECFGHGTAAFMIRGRVCTRRCPSCEVGLGRPLPADALRHMQFNHVLITSVDRDGLRDGGARHFGDCVAAVCQPRAGADYRWSLGLIRQFGEHPPQVRTKSGLMVGLGKTVDEIKDVLHDLRQNDYKMLTIGKYFTPSDSHVAVERYYRRAQSDGLWHFAESIGFENVTSGPLVRSTYYADRQSGLLLGKAH